MKVLHVGFYDKFLAPFIELINENFDHSQHEFFLCSGIEKAPEYEGLKVFQRTIIERIKFYFFALIKMHSADKVILHGLCDIKLVVILFFNPWLLKKCHWVIWGGDLYVYLGKENKKWRRDEFFRRPVIRKMGHLVTYIEGDVQLARQWYSATGRYHECIMYPSNLYKEYNIPCGQQTTINIQVGNSADPTNNHFEVLEKLLPFKEQDIAIYVPLSYGDQDYAQKVRQQGQEWFGDKFKPLTEFLPFEQYLELLGIIDIAIFNHRRQQAMGNTITLLGLGKTVYLRSDTTQWQLFKEKDIVVGNVENFDGLYFLNTDNNKDKIEKYFSKENFINQLRGIFQDTNLG